MLNRSHAEEMLPHNAGCEEGFRSLSTLSARPLPFGGGSKSSSSQSTSNKDNSAVVEDQGQSASDGSRAARAEDEATSVSGGGNMVDNSEVSGGSVNAEKGAEVIGGGALAAGGNVDLQDSSLTIETVSDDVLEDAFDFGSETVRESIQNARLSQEAANLLSRTTNEVIAGIASEKTEDSASDIFKNLQRNLLIGALIFGGVLIITRKAND